MSLSALAFLGVYATSLFLALVRHPIFGLYAYLWAFYNHPPSRWWGSALPDLRWSLIAAVVAFIAAVRVKPSPGRRPWHANYGARLLILFTIWMWLQSLWAVDSEHHLEGCILFTKYVVLFYTIYKIVYDERTLELFSWGHVAGCFLFGWIGYQTTVSGRLESVGGPGVDDSITLSMHLVTGLAFAGFMLLGLEGKKRWVILAVIPFILNAVILTASRGGFLALFGAGLTALYLTRRSERRLAYAAMVLGTVLLFMLANDLFMNRMNTIWTTEKSEMDVSAGSRFDFVEYGWRMFKDYPLGTGYGGHKILSPAYMPAQLLAETGQRAAHNTFMNVLVEQGYPGAVLFLAIQAWAARILWRLKSLDKTGLPASLTPYRAAVGTGLAAWFVAGQFANFLMAEVYIWLLALLTSLYSAGLDSLSAKSTDAMAETAISGKRVEPLPAESIARL